MGKKFIIAIDLGGTNLKIALLDLRYRIVSKHSLSTRRFSTKQSLILALVASISELLSRNRLNKKQVLGVGIGLPGPVDTRRGLVHFFPNIPGWKEVYLRNILEKKTGLYVSLDNDANLMSLAEYKLGSAKNSVNAVCLTLGTGVGGGLIINAKLYRAEGFAAGEIGHLPLGLRGPRCNCGGEACLEAFIGNKRILEMARKIFSRDISLEELSFLANKKKDKRAVGLWQKVGGYLGVALSAVVNLLNPDCIVIGGGVANAGKVLFDEVKRVIRRRAMPLQAKQVRVLKAKLGPDAGLIGAAILVKEGV